MTESLIVHTGYRSSERQKTVPLYEAFQILSTKARRRYTKAVRHGDTATLYAHLYHCPHCGEVTPAYDHALFHDTAPPVINKTVLATWAQVQTSLFDDVPALLPIQSPIEAVDAIPCPHCQTMTKPLMHPHTVQIETTANGITLDCSGRRLVMDLARGECYTTLHCQNGDYRPQSTSEKPDRFFVDLINEYHIIRQHIRRALRPFWPNGFPYNAENLTFDRCVLLTKFINFPRSFYDEIPQIQRENETTSPIRFRTPDEAQTWFSRSPLFRYKSLRRVVFLRPSLLFYLEELEWLFATLTNVDLLHSVLQQPHIFWLLHFFQYYSGARLYFEDFARIRGGRALERALSDFTDKHSPWYRNAIHYAATAPSIRKTLQDDRTPADCTNVSLPLAIPPYLQNDRIQGFVFYCLKNTAECYKAGLEMHNCLTDWNSSSPVVIVYRHKQIVAAIEVYERRIVQAYQPYNQPIEQHTPLWQAIDKWCRKYRIQWDGYSEECLPY